LLSFFSCAARLTKTILYCHLIIVQVDIQNLNKNKKTINKSHTQFDEQEKFFNTINKHFGFANELQCLFWYCLKLYVSSFISISKCDYL